MQGESPPAWGKVGPSRTGSSLIVDISTLSVASADKKRPNNKNTVSGGSMKRSVSSSVPTVSPSPWSCDI